MGEKFKPGSGVLAGPVFLIAGAFLTIGSLWNHERPWNWGYRMKGLPPSPFMDTTSFLVYLGFGVILVAWGVGLILRSFRHRGGPREDILDA